VKVKACGKIHPDGVPCTKPVMYEQKCCHEQQYEHDGPHEHYDRPLEEGGVITHRWEEQLQIMDLPYDAYRPWTDEDIKKAEAAANGQAAMA
jgi:hypothetical protein